MKSIVSLLSAPGLRAAVTFALAGGGFVVATLVMARILDEGEFSKAVIMIALCNVAVAAAPAGLNGIALRHNRRVDRRLVVAGIACVIAAALIAVTLAGLLYGLRLPATAVLGLAILTGGGALLTKSAFQRSMALQRMVVLYQLPNVVLLLVAGLMVIGIGRVHWFPTLVVAVAYIAIGAYAWRWVGRHQQQGQPIDRRLLRDAFSFGGVALAGEVMTQLERLIIPLAMDEGQLALYAVVAAVALSPYRMLELGTIATLVARLRQTREYQARLRLLRKELVLLLTLCIAGGCLILLVAPTFCELALNERRVSTSLVLAVVLSGITRVCSAFAHSTALAFCEGSDLVIVNAGNWIAIVTGATLGAVMAPLGLEAMIYGVMGGWICKALLSGYLGARQLRQRQVA